MDKNCKNIVITGGNRGIGLELVKEVIAKLKPDNLIATYRDAANSKELLELASKYENAHAIVLDVKAVKSYSEFASKVEGITKGAGINLLINNAGICNWKNNGALSELQDDDLLLHFQVDCLAPIMLSKALLPQLEKASGLGAISGAQLGIERAVILNVSTIMASMGGNLYPTVAYGYQLSKAALNQASKNMSIELKEKGILVVPLHPGWVKTEMGGPNADLDASQSASGIVNVLENLDESMNGRFLDYAGKELPW